MAGAFKSIHAFFQDAAQVGADGRYGLETFMVAIYIKIVFFKKGKGIHGEFSWVVQDNSFLFARQSRKELSEITDGCNRPGKGKQSDGCLSNKTPSFHRPA